MQMFFKFLTGKTVTLELEEPISAKEVLAMIRAKEGDEYFSTDKKVILCVAGRALEDNDFFHPAEKCIIFNDGYKQDLIDINHIHILRVSLTSASEKTKKVGTSSNFSPSRYQQFRSN